MVQRRAEELEAVGGKSKSYPNWMSGQEKNVYENYEDLEERARADIDWREWAPQMVEQKMATIRDVKVTDQRDINELLRLPNPMRPTDQMQLVQIQLDDGTFLERPQLKDLKALKPTSLRPVTFKWVDRSEYQTGAPKEYDDIIQRLLNSSPADMEELVRSNWKKFDQAFFFRITELKEDAKQAHLKDKLTNLERMCIDLIQAAQEQSRKSVPETQEDAKNILYSMLEDDGDTLLWPAPREAFAKLAENITTRATRNKYADGWFENIIESIERFGKKMNAKGDTVYFELSQICMQRLVTEWLRHDDLWEETKEGQFLFRLMLITYESWDTQLSLEEQPLDSHKIREELKIISENKIVKLPMASKLQIYAAKYIQAIVEWTAKRDEMLKMSKKEKDATTA